MAIALANLLYRSFERVGKGAKRKGRRSLLFGKTEERKRRNKNGKAESKARAAQKEEASKVNPTMSLRRMN
jgi:hypothetical protein